MNITPELRLLAAITRMDMKELDRRLLQQATTCKLKGHKR